MTRRIDVVATSRGGQAILPVRLRRPGGQAGVPVLHWLRGPGGQAGVPVLHLLIAIALLLPGACRKAETAVADTAHAHAADAAHTYYCPMHPTVTSNKPGACPICGMALVKRPVATASTAATPGAIALSADQRVTGNVRTARATLAAQTSDIVTTGRVTVDERRMSQVTSYTAGRVERLFANFTGDVVRRGDAVAAIYSPDLYATQQEYLVALQNRDRMHGAGFESARDAAYELAASARRRLLLSGMTAGQVATLERTRRPIQSTTIVSPVSGIVTRKLVVEQQYVAQGQPLVELADLSTVWIEADVYEQQLANVRVGERAAIEANAIPGRTFEGRVSFIVPLIEGATRTARVRIELPNPGVALKPDMFVTVRISGAPAAPQVMVPATALIDRGQSQFVWVETAPGSYEPRQVQAGARSGEMVAIVSGIAEGDNVVVEGGFLLDSEAQLRR